MHELKLGQNIIRLRREAGITQDQLASYIGVSKSSVSKWETNTSYPDIILLPQLATLFHVSVDELMGYEPQLTQESILSIYRELAEAFADDPRGTYQKAQEYSKKYYACFPFLYQMAVLLLNHFSCLEHPFDVLEEAIQLCKRIEAESDNPSLIKDTVVLEAMLLIHAQRPQEVLEILGEEIKPLSQESEILAACYQQMGNMEKVNEIQQVCIYQHLLYFVQDSINYMMMNLADERICKETIERLQPVFSNYQLDQLHVQSAIMFYLSAISVYVQYNEIEKALDMLEAYTKLWTKEGSDPFHLHGDAYFTKIETWMQNLQINTTTPLGKALMKKSIVASITDNPQFTALHEEFRYKTCVEKLQASMK